MLTKPNLHVEGKQAAALHKTVKSAPKNAVRPDSDTKYERGMTPKQKAEFTRADAKRDNALAKQIKRK